MAKCNFAKEEHLKYYGEDGRVLTGGKDCKRHLYNQLIKSMEKAEGIDIIVSFLMESGVHMIIPDLKKAANRGAKIRILTGSYLGITQPSALYLIKNTFDNQIEMRFYSEKKSFHPKAYFFYHKDKNEVYIGSSNMSRSALTSGIEWNYRLDSNRDSEAFYAFYDTFLDLYNNHSVVLDDDELKRYSDNWHQPLVMKDILRAESRKNSANEPVPIFQPRGAQIEALYALNQTRMEGASKALIQAATGIGKTYLAAFDSKDYDKVLFVAHREEILIQAMQSFCNVRQTKDCGYFNGSQKDTKQSVIFASVATLGQNRYLNDEYFTKNYFDYIVVDEFHHAVNDSYQRILEYFQPKFMLGLTATPERMDKRSIYGICDYNVPFELSLFDAINKGMLVPFHYYGVYDDTNYSDIHRIGGRYTEQDLNRKYIGNEQRVNVIVKHYNKYSKKRAIGFCATRAHAEMMAEEFCKRNIPSVAVYSNANGKFSEERCNAIRKLKQGDIHVIFSVDMFNEGTDIPELDMVMFLRPTESPTIFLQQLGRGLRLSHGKEYLNVLDFIGNYEMAGKVTRYLTKDFSANKNSSERHNEVYPDGCLVDFDIRLIDLFSEIEKARKGYHAIVCEEYYRVKEVLGYIPSRVELFNEMDSDVYEICMTRTKENIFKNYLQFLQSIDELSIEEQEIFQSIAGDFLHEIETTGMTKVYKMPVLLSFYNNGEIRSRISDVQVLDSWKEFFNRDTNWKDLKEGITFKQYKEISDKEHLKKIRLMPIKHLESTFFVHENGYELSICKDVIPFLKNDIFKKHFKDIINYRTVDYYRRRYVNRKHT